MWIISVLPDWVFHLILITGVVGSILGLFLSFIPFVNKYKLPIQIISLILFSLGLYLEGALADSKEWQARVSEMEQKVAEAAVKSEQTNTQIVTKVITKNQVITEKGEEVIKYVDREIVKYDNICPVPKEVVTAINAAAQNKTIEEKK